MLSLRVKRPHMEGLYGEMEIAGQHTKAQPIE